MFSYFSYGWEPIISPNEVQPSWKTFTSQCFSLAKIEKYHADPTKLIGLRHHRWTQYCMIDIDHASCYRSEASIRDICWCLSDIGLCLPILFQSSFKGDFAKGLHIYWFLDKEVNTRNLSDLIHNQLELGGFIISPGNLEIFPSAGNGANCKFKAARLPLQPNSGSWILDDDLLPYNNSIDCLNKLITFNLNTPDFSNFDLENEPSELIPSQKANDWLKGVNRILLKGWTSPSQTQKIIRAAIDKVVVFGKITDVNLVVIQVKLIVINLPSYTQYCGHQRDIDKYIKSWVIANIEKGVRMPYRRHPEKIIKAKNLFKVSSQRNENIVQINKARNINTLKRLIACINWLVENEEVSFKTVRSFRLRLSELSTALYGVGISPKIVQQHKAIWQNRIIFSTHNNSTK